MELTRQQRRTTFWEREGTNDYYTFGEYEDYLEHGSWELLEWAKYLREGGIDMSQEYFTDNLGEDANHNDGFDEDSLEEELREVDTTAVLLDPDEVDPIEEEPWKIPR